MSDSKAGPSGAANVPATTPPTGGAVASAPPATQSGQKHAREREKREPPPMQHSIHMEQKKVPPEVFGTRKNE